MQIRILNVNNKMRAAVDVAAAAVARASLLFFFATSFSLLLLLFAEMGVVHGARKSADILHGKVVDIKEYPYQVALLNTKFNKIICGGVIVKPKVIFTAAHCTHTRNLTPRQNLAVLVGANYVDDYEGRIHHIDKVVKHPLFNYIDLENDISVVTLKEPIEFDEKAKSIPISTDDHPGGTVASASGWGRTEFGVQSTNLRAVDVQLEHHHKCQDHFPGLFHPRITHNMVCLKPHRKSTYYGDSGGPLTVDGKLVGLVSFGRPIKPNKKTSVFTKVGNYLDFVEEVLPEEYKDE